MSVPQSCHVLVVGGGPAGSFAASALAREGFDVVVLEADKFPRYHIGESMLPSMRHYLKLIDLYDKFEAHGWTRKNGAAFRLTKGQPEVASDFIDAGGPGGYAWNVIRSEFDDMLFKHAGDCGARTFDQTKVKAVQFEKAATNGAASDKGKVRNPGRPVSATWSRKDGTSGTITFKYMIDASGRNGFLSTKYLKNRRFNESLKNIASWGYWKGGETYAKGTHSDNYPYFEALQDASGWCWYIPLHDGTHSVGIVQNMQLATSTKRKHGAKSPSTKELYMQALNLVPRIKRLLSKGELVTDVKSASDWSYSAPDYAFPGARIAGDAGCFIDPFFSSGVHLAIASGLSAAVTIAASIRGDCDEQTAVDWHSKKTAASYTRFFLLVSSAMKQISSQEQPIIQDIDEEGFQRAFDLFRPVIQGTVDANVSGQLSQSDIPKMVEFSFKAFVTISPEEKDALFEKLKHVDAAGADDAATAQKINDIEKSLTPEESEVLDVLRSRRMFSNEGFDMDTFTFDSIDGLVPNLVRGKLGLAKAAKRAAAANGAHLYSTEFLGRPSSLRFGNAGDDTNGTDAASRDINGAADKVLASLEGYRDQMADEKSRHSVISALNEAAEDLEEPFDLMMRLANAGNMTPMIKVGYQLGVFKALVASSTPLSVEQLCKPTGADPRLVSRVLRYLAANRFIKEADKGHFTASKATRSLADARTEGGMNVYYDVIDPMLHELPPFLAEAKYQNTVGSPCVFNRMAKTDLIFYHWLGSQPEMIKDFQCLMAVPRAGDWLSAVPFAEAGAAEDGPVFVDVGGNVGHQCLQVKAKHPGLAGRIVLQDLEEVIDAAPAIEGVERMAHDFFTPQPVQGSRYYYLRTILHNWDDDKAVKILRNLVPAMGPDSQILIDEIAVPSAGAHVWPSVQDLLMMMTFGARERTMDEWTALLDRAGLRIVEIKTYAAVMRTSIIVAQPKS